MAGECEGAGLRHHLKNVAIVFQKTFLTRDSVLENIRRAVTPLWKKCGPPQKRRRSTTLSCPCRMATTPRWQLRLPLLRRRKAAHRYRPGHPEKCPDPDFGRGHQCLRPGKSNGDRQSHPKSLQGQDRHCGGPPAQCPETVRPGGRGENHTITSVGTHEEVRRKNAYYRKAWEDYEKARNITYRLEGGAGNA